MSYMRIRRRLYLASHQSRRTSLQTSPTIPEPSNSYLIPCTLLPTSAPHPVLVPICRGISIVQFQCQSSYKPRDRFPFIDPDINQIFHSLEPFSIFFHCFLTYELHCALFAVKDECLVCGGGKHACTSYTTVL